MLLGALIVGVVPALKATGSRLQSSLRALGGATGIQMGRTWSLLVVAQVAFTVAALPTAVFFAWDFARHGGAEPGSPAEEFISATLVMDREAPPSAEAAAYARDFDARYASLESRLLSALAVEPGVSGVALAAHLPGQEPTVRIEVEGVPTPGGSISGHPARSGRVDIDFFDTFDVPLLDGRGFHSGDLDPQATSVIVNRAFVREILGDGQALGRRIRYAAGYRSGGVVRIPAGVEMGEWYEVAGVVGDLPANPMEPGATQAMLYHPLAPGQVYPPTLSVRVLDAGVAAFSPRLREIAAALDPALRLVDARPLDVVLTQWQTGMRMAALAILLVTLSVLLLSAAGIYALMSLTVVQRRREIGIRSALGADPRHILAGIFSRAAAQLAAGAALGVVAAVLIDRLAGGMLAGGEGAVVLPAVAVLMVSVGLIGALGPARQGLRIEPTEALKAEM